MPTPALGLIAGNNRYPFLAAAAARAAGVPRVCAAAFEGETDPALAGVVDEIEWLRVGQLGRLIRAFQRWGIDRAMMCGQIAPRNLFDLRPDFRALLMLAKLRERNAESIFGAIAAELAAAGVTLLPATTYLEDQLAAAGALAGPRPSRGASRDVAFGMRVAKAVSALDIGQSVVVKKGTVLAVEAFEGTDDCLRRGGALGRGGAVLCKVSKPGQDFRFDVPVIGRRTVETAAGAGVAVLAVEAGRTLLLDKEELFAACDASRVTLFGAETDSASAA